MATLTPIGQLDDQPVDSIVTVQATLRALQLKRNKFGKLWATLRLKQAGDAVTVLVFAQTFAAISDGVLRQDTTLHFDARVLRDLDGITKLAPVTSPEVSEASGVV